MKNMLKIASLKLRLALLRAVIDKAYALTAMYERLQEKLAIAKALPPGTAVMLTDDPTHSGYPNWHFTTTWEVEHYNPDVDDYSLRTTDAPERDKVRGYATTYAKLEAMKVVKW